MCLEPLAKSWTSVMSALTLFVCFASALSLPLSYSLALPKPSDWSSHARVKELCRHRNGGQEGKTLKGFKLLQAFVITTPGLRYHDVGEQLEYSPELCHFGSFSNDHPLEKIHLYSQILDDKSVMRGGNQKAYSAFRMFDATPNSHRCKMDSLTSLGVTQSIWLGEYLSSAYHKLWALHKPFAFARTVGDETLYQTASAVLYGLLHEKQFVENHVEKLNRDYAPAGIHGTSNQDVDDDHSHYFIESSFEKEHHLFKDGLSPTTSRHKIDHLFGADVPAKSIISHSALSYCPTMAKKTSFVEPPFHGKESPHHHRPYSISHVLSMSDKHNAYLSADSFFQSYARSRTLPFRKFLRAWTKASTSKFNPEINIVAADDLFLLSLLTSLTNESLTQHITPVTRVVFEKFTFNSSTTALEDSSQNATQFDSGSSSNAGRKLLDVSESLPVENIRNQFFRVLLNGRVVTQNLEGCALDPMISLGLCSSSTLLAALQGKDEDEFDLDKDEL